MKKTLLIFVLCWLPNLGHAQQTLLVFGDSLSAGYGIARESSWPMLLQKELTQSHSQYVVVNASISGETTSGGRARIVTALREHKPAIVILELGANDGLRGMPLATSEANLAYMVKQCTAAGAKVLLLGMMIPPNYGLDYAAQFKAMYARLSQRYHTGLVPFFLDGVTPEQFQADNLHPIAEAQPRILQNVMGQLKKMLSAK